jgi:manganese/iron transport system permease protein
MTHPADLFKPEFEFVLRGLAAGLIVAFVCAYLSVFVVLKRIVFVGAALAEVGTVGVALSFLPAVAHFALLRHLDPEETRPLLLALVCVVAGVLFFAHQASGGTIPREAVIGVSYVAATAFAVLCLSVNAGAHDETHDLVNGEVMTITMAAVRQLLCFAVPIALVHLLLFKEFTLVSFDREYAQTLGYRARSIELLFYLTLGLMIAVAIKVVGTLLVFGYLVLPAVTALKLTRRMNVAFVLAIGAAVVATVAGIYLSAWEGSNFPMGPAIVASSAVLLALTWPLRLAAGRR